ncbi:hypothetical protein BDV96DRAFT_18022 [Lophiotrema nucula]|uniref:DUF7702 domain-containing protein n=1 Tax=Lophiotrema nucula TaxID=690887 RepID=A0A6A5ZCY0_9PLEO|nr:hypothetical protein BDV96DRAFT_18022 [Lophiotrema nucula]
MPSALLVATIIVYAVLIQPISYCIWKHGTPGLLGWLVIQVFCVVRIVGSALQIHDETTGSTSTAALVVASIGLSPLLLGVAGVLHEARTARDPGMNTKIEWIKVIAFHAQVILAMVLLLIGITQEIGDKTSHATPLMKVGVVMILLCAVVFSAWTRLSFNQVPRTDLPAWKDATLLLKSVFVVLPFVLLRTLYSVIATFSTDSSFKNSLAAKVCMSVVPEMLLVAVLVASGIITRNIVDKRRIKGVERDTLAGAQHYPLLQTQG